MLKENEKKRIVKASFYQKISCEHFEIAHDEKLLFCHHQLTTVLVIFPAVFKTPGKSVFSGHLVGGIQSQAEYRTGIWDAMKG